MKTLSIKTQFHDMQELLNDVTKSVQKGEIDAMEVFHAMRFMEKSVAHASKSIKPNVLFYLETVNARHEPWRYDGHEFKLESGGGRWDFDHIPEINELEEQLKALKERHKMAYRIHVSGGVMVDDETGEIVTPASYRSYDDKIVVRLSK